MSYISTADAGVLRAMQPALPSRRVLAGPGIETPWPVGRALEVLLFLATSGAVSLVFCTAVAGAMLN